MTTHTIDIEEALADAKWRIENDRPSRDQFKPLRAYLGFLCECICDDRHVRRKLSAVWARPPMPEKRAKFTHYLCESCYLKLPETQEAAP